MIVAGNNADLRFSGVNSIYNLAERAVSFIIGIAAEMLLNNANQIRTFFIFKNRKCQLFF